MIVVTGAAGFIGSCLVSKLNHLGFGNLLLVDDFSFSDKNKNLKGKTYIKCLDRSIFISWFSKNASKIKFVYHIGARTNTIESNMSIFNKLNLNYSKSLWTICSAKKIPYIYASSAATYGTGRLGFNDNHTVISKLKPLNPYGRSKNEFDKWVLTQKEQPPFWVGLKFFNVYGPNEFHKKRMASIIFHAVNQIHLTRKMQLFKSHHSDYQDGAQARDFIYVKDIVDVLTLIMESPKQSGIYNLGTGIARTFNDLAKIIFQAMSIEENILFIDTPSDIRNNYQYFTQANMQKLDALKYDMAFTSLEQGVEDYIQNYLLKNRYY